MINVCTVLFAPQDNARRHTKEHPFTEFHVEQLHYYFSKALTLPFRFITFVDTYRDGMPGEQILLEHPPALHSEVEPYRLDEPMLACGLDTCPIENIDAHADYALNGDRLLLSNNSRRFLDVGWQIAPKHIKSSNEADIRQRRKGCMDITQRDIYESWDWSGSARLHIGQHGHTIEDVFPGEACSYRFTKDKSRMKVIYWHGTDKPHRHKWWRERLPYKYEYFPREHN